MSTNPFTLVPALYRKWVYGGYAIILFLLGAIEVGIESADATFPLWLVVASEVWKYVGIPVAALAASNVGPEDRPKPAPQA